VVAEDGDLHEGATTQQYGCVQRKERIQWDEKTTPQTAEAETKARP